MRVERGHGGQPAVVRDSEDADAPVVFGYVLNQPVNRVVGVRAFVDGL